MVHRIVVHPGVRAGAKRGRRIWLTFALLTAALRAARLDPPCESRLLASRCRSLRSLPPCGRPVSATPRLR
jgi:hypothetical protein